MNVRTVIGVLLIAQVMVGGFLGAADVVPRDKKSEFLSNAARGSTVPRDNSLEAMKAILRQYPQVINAVDEDGETALWKATKKGHVDIVEWLLTQAEGGKGLVNKADSKGVTPLEKSFQKEGGGALSSERYKIADLLLGHGAGMDKISDADWSKYISNAAGTFDISPGFLLKVFAGKRDVFTKIVQEDDFFIQDLLVRFWYGKSKKQENDWRRVISEIIKKMIPDDAKLLDVLLQIGKARMPQRDQLIELLLEEGLLSKEVCASNIAKLYKHEAYEVIVSLLDKIKLEGLSAEDYENMMCVAAEHKKEGLGALSNMLKKRPVRDNHFLLQHLLKNENYDEEVIPAIQKFITEGILDDKAFSNRMILADLWRTKAFDKITKLYKTVPEPYRKDLIESLFASVRQTSDINEKFFLELLRFDNEIARFILVDKSGKSTVLHKFLSDYATFPKKKLETLVQALIDVGADVNAMASDGESPLSLALEGLKFNVALMLIKAGADTKGRTKSGQSMPQFFMDVKKELDQTLLAKAEIKELDTLLKPDENELGLFRLEELLRKADSKSVDDYLEIAGLAKHVDPNKQYSEGSLLHIFLNSALKNVQRGEKLFSYRIVSIIDMLVGADPSCVHKKDALGNTPLHLVCKAGSQLLEYKFLDVIKKLVSAGANIKVKNNGGKTAYQIYAEKESPGYLWNNDEVRKVLEPQLEADDLKGLTQAELARVVTVNMNKSIVDAAYKLYAKRYHVDRFIEKPVERGADRAIIGHILKENLSSEYQKINTYEGPIQDILRKWHSSVDRKNVRIDNQEYDGVKKFLTAIKDTYERRKNFFTDDVEKRRNELSVELAKNIQGANVVAVKKTLEKFKENHISLNYLHKDFGGGWSSKSPLMAVYNEFKVSSSQDYALLDALLEHGADVHYENPYVGTEERSVFIKALTSKDEGILKHLFSKKINLFHEYDSSALPYLTPFTMIVNEALRDFSACERIFVTCLTSCAEQIKNNNFLVVDYFARESTTPGYRKPALNRALMKNGPNDIDVARLLLDAGASPTQEFYDFGVHTNQYSHWTPLHQAIHLRKKDFFSLFMEEKYREQVDVNAQIIYNVEAKKEKLNEQDEKIVLTGQKTETPLHLIVKKNEFSAADIRKIFERGPDLSLVDHNGLTARQVLENANHPDKVAILKLFDQYAVQFFSYINQKNYEKTAAYIAGPTFNENVVDAQGNTILHAIVDSNFTPENKKKLILQLRSKLSSGFVNNKNNQGNTPLLLAAAKKESEIAMLLSAFTGADVNLTDSSGKSFMDYLDDNPDLQRKNAAHMKYEVYVTYVQDGGVQALKKALSGERDLSDIRDPLGNTLLHAAINQSNKVGGFNTRIVEQLIIHNVAPKNFILLKNLDGKTPLHLLGADAKVDFIVTALKNKGWKNDDFESLFEIFEEAGNIVAQRYLILKENCYPKNLNLFVNKLFEGELHQVTDILQPMIQEAIRRGQVALVKRFFEKINKLSGEAKNDMMNKNVAVWGLLHWAIYADSKDIFDYLLEQGISPNKEHFIESAWVLPIQYLTYKGKLEWAKELLNREPTPANIAATKNKAGYTPLAFAVSMGKPDFVNLFLGHNKSYRNKAGKTLENKITDTDKNAVLTWAKSQPKNEALTKIITLLEQGSTNDPDFFKADPASSSKKKEPGTGPTPGAEQAKTKPQEPAVSLLQVLKLKMLHLLGVVSGSGQARAHDRGKK
ncbi:MAG: ankyrin repeat domain-containing protein [Epsilonproteobacteria bacterium]|nr:ankyrin repeat domain-containing protein [Campylobacterota bacterium]